MGRARTIQSWPVTTSGIPTAPRCRRSNSWNCSSANCRVFNEEELRAIWSVPPILGQKLLQELAEKGFWLEQMAEMQRIIDAENSDLFDVLAHARIQYPLTRRQAARTK